MAIRARQADLRRFELDGLFLSTLLAAAYAPAFNALRNAGERVLDELEPGPEPGAENWPAADTPPNGFRVYLELDTGFVESLRVGLAVLAPLASGLVTLLLPS